MKKYLLLALFVSFVLLTNLSFAAGSLTITWQVLDSEVRPGGETTVFLTLTNPSTTIEVRTIKLYISPGPYVTPSTYYAELGGLGVSKTQQTSLIAEIDSAAVSTTSYLRVRATYFTDSTQKEINVNVPITIGRVPILQVSNIKYSLSPIEPGSTVLLNFDLVNNGDGPAKDIKIVLNQTTELFITESEEVFLSQVDPNQVANVSFILTIDPSVDVGIYSIPLSLEYLDETKTENYSSIKYVGLTISGKPEFVFEIEKTENLYSGAKGEITISIANRGTATAEFLTTKPKFGSDVIKEIYIGDLEPDDYETISFDLDLGTTDPGKYPLTVSLEYRDPYNQEFSEEKTLEFTVTRRPFKIPTNVNIIIFLIIIVVVYWKRSWLIGLFKKKK